MNFHIVHMWVESICSVSFIFVFCWQHYCCLHNCKYSHSKAPCFSIDLQWAVFCVTVSVLIWPLHLTLAPKKSSLLYSFVGWRWITSRNPLPSVWNKFMCKVCGRKWETNRKVAICCIGFVTLQFVTAPLKGIPSRVPAGGFRSASLNSPSLSRPPLSRTPAGRKDGGIKLLDINEQPLGYAQAKKRKRMQGKYDVKQ